MSTQFENVGRRAWWSVHLEAWQKSGLSQRKYCATHGLSERPFRRWIAVLVDAESLKLQRKFDAEERRRRRDQRRKTPGRDKRKLAVQGFWAMHVEALHWSGLSIRDYAWSLHLSPFSLRNWRARIEDGEVEIDWRALLHPSARAKLRPRTKEAFKESGAETDLTDAGADGSADALRMRRRHFSEDEKLAIVLACDAPGATVSSVARAHDLATSALFRWRAERGYGRSERVRFATVRASSTRGDGATDPLILTGLVPLPDGMLAVDQREVEQERPS